VLVLGEERLGKTAYVRRFFQSKFGKNFEISLHRHSQIYSAQMKDAEMTMNVRFLDSKGYGTKLDPKIWAKNIKEIVGKGIEEYRRSKKGRSRAIEAMKSFTESQVPAVKDSRIHLGLYFLAGTKIKFTDVYYMKQFSKYMNIIPILAKEKKDGESVKELKNLKKGLAKEAEQCGINWVNCQNVRTLLLFLPKVDLEKASKPAKRAD
jgi:septin family protein